jgi:malonate-semialdehyde dehydrogenase (acetylating)/methylmalonate-semialdehyde dehydrogenase
MLRVNTLEEGIALASNHPYGNGVALFTRSGEAARRFAEQVEVGMVGINVPIPVPVAHHGFGGWKRSAFGDLNQYGTDSLRFFTRTKIVTQRWSGDAAPGSSFVIPSSQPE